MTLAILNRAWVLSFILDPPPPDALRLLPLAQAKE